MMLSELFIILKFQRRLKLVDYCNDWKRIPFDANLHLGQLACRRGMSTPLNNIASGREPVTTPLAGEPRIDLLLPTGPQYSYLNSYNLAISRSFSYVLPHTPQSPRQSPSMYLSSQSPPTTAPLKTPTNILPLRP